MILSFVSYLLRCGCLNKMLKLFNKIIEVCYSLRITEKYKTKNKYNIFDVIIVKCLDQTTL